MVTDTKPVKEPAERVIKESIAKILKEKELANDVLYERVKKDTGFGISKIKKYLNEMVGAVEVEEKRRKPPIRKKTTYALTNKGRERWL